MRNTIIFVGLASPLVLLSIGTALAVHTLGLFEIDDPANAFDDSGLGPPDDWDNVFDGTDSSIQSIFITDGSGKGDDIFQTGGSKDIQDVSEWQRSTGNVPDKNDMLHAFAAAYTDTNGNLIVYFGADRKANNGDAQIGFWFFKDEIGVDGNSGFTGEHKIGDVLVISNFIGGGDVSNIQVYKWAGADGIGGFPELFAEATQEGAFFFCTPGDEACASTNAGGEPSPWDYDPKFGDTGFFPEVSLFEGGVNFSALLGDEIGCFSNFLAETRSSQSITAQLKDYALGNFSLCDLAMVKDGDTLSKVGDDVDYDITVTNTGAVKLWKQSIVDDVLGDLTGDAGCDDFLDPGDSCNINVTRTVLTGDPDPLPNTVQVIYNSSASLLGDEVSRSDDHSVNLIQPAIAVDKTGDVLSMVGDDVNYTITLSNNSSADTPALSCTATDSLLGSVFNGVLPPGDTVITPSRTVQAGDPNPLVNTVSMTCSVAGFPNVLSGSASHSTNLFQSDVEVIKTGPNKAFHSQTITYNFTINNLSSADSPDLILDNVTDTKIGDLTAAAAAGGCGTLAVGGSCSFSADYTIPFFDGTRLINVVTIHYHPDGFPNDITDNDDHTVYLPDLCEYSQSCIHDIIQP
jgi:hypothetical protein